ncbi:putative 2-hydroxyacid dehydrogenase [Polychaeton citri CBS 116435]|uniref:2-hydroxyacid dehydrogenase n=1 Tax=Polychaeton citri CBS 116435 TaxID=1314669 RepID=A0A9P4UTY5_9PEZI|nr:putative 2-hydroxyacid dehydrogenase [Polychaeton citri CBS 116435]
MSSSRINESKRPRVVILGKPKFIGNEYLSKFSQDYNFSVLEADNREQTKRLLPEDIQANGPIDAFVIRMGTPPYEPFDKDLLGALAPDCRIITSASAGYNEFDVEWMTENGIYMCNTLNAVAEPTADMSMFLIIAVLRNTSSAERSARAGTWRNVDGLIPARDPSGLTLGIVGMGSIGKYLAKKAAAFNMKIRYYNRKQLPPDVEAQYAASYCSSLHELLAASDVVSVNCPLNAETTNLIGENEFGAMKDGSFLVNTARGAVIDQKALKTALESGKVARAGLDVLCDEPNVDPWFLQHNRVIVQPHLGGLTDVAGYRAERECFENVRALFEKGYPNSPVNRVAGKSQ